MEVPHAVVGGHRLRAARRVSVGDGATVGRASALDPVWLRAAFVFTLIGFGTKMGLAPMHSWKPDTYGEAPCLVGGLMSGALTSSAAGSGA